MNTEMDYILFEWFMLDKKKQGNQLKVNDFEKQWEID